MLVRVATAGRGVPEDDNDGDRDGNAERPACDNIRKPMHGEHKSAEPNEPCEQYSDGGEYELSSSMVRHRNRQDERCGEEEPRRIGRVTGRKGGTAHVGFVNRDRRACSSYDRLCNRGTESGEQ